MKTKSLICCITALLTITALAGPPPFVPPEFSSPYDYAAHLERKLARFEGIWF